MYVYPLCHALQVLYYSDKYNKFYYDLLGNEKMWVINIEKVRGGEKGSGRVREVREGL